MLVNRSFKCNSGKKEEEYEQEQLCLHIYLTLLVCNSSSQMFSTKLILFLKLEIVNLLFRFVEHLK